VSFVNVNLGFVHVYTPLIFVYNPQFQIPSNNPGGSALNVCVKFIAIHLQDGRIAEQFKQGFSYADKLVLVSESE